MLPKLEGYAAARLGALDTGALVTVARDLASLEQTILGQANLHAVLSDTSVRSTARGQVLRALLQGKVSETALDLAVYAAVEAPAQEVPHAIAELALDARRVSEDGSIVASNLGLLAARERVSGYADAMLDQVTTENFSQIEHELFTWAHYIRNNADLRRLLTDRDAPVRARLAVTRQLLDGKVHSVTLALACYVIEGGRPRDVSGSVDYLVDYVAKARDWRIARIHTARALDQASQDELVASLTSVTGKSVELQIAREPSLLGGLLIEIGDLRLDATTKGRLGVLHDALSSGRLYESAINRND